MPMNPWASMRGMPSTDKVPPNMFRFPATSMVLSALLIDMRPLKIDRFDEFTMRAFAEVEFVAKFCFFVVCNLLDRVVLEMKNKY